MKMRNIFVLMLTLAMVFVLCACGAVENEEAAPTTTAPTVTAPTEGETEPTDDGKVTYTVKVVDEAGNPVVGTYFVQLCDDNGCVPCMTPENGVFTWRLAENTYTAKFTGEPPAGYTYATEEKEFHFEDGSYELTIVLKAAA